MRIAIINSSRNIIGGVETYLRQLLPALIERGHEVAFWHEETPAAGHEVITLPPEVPSWSVAQLGTKGALAALREWQPELIYAHGLRSPELEAETQKIAPSVFFAHSYYGSCVSGAKTFSFPVVQPCDRQFGWQCLAHYYPHRCGGLNPRTMWSQYQFQKKRLSLLSGYSAIVVSSSHMVREYRKYGLPDPSVVYYPIAPVELKECSGDHQQTGEPWRLLFLARMDPLKGGGVMLEALPSVARAVARPLHVTLAGDGQARSALERQAAQVAADNPLLKFDFTGWLDEAQRGKIFRDCSLLIVPSLLPEPFGMVGLEAGMFGVPAVAFDVGGISDWLKDGVNGTLAPGNPPRAVGLSDAIVRCLGRQDLYENLRLGARDQAQQFSMKNHLALLLPILTRVLSMSS